MIKNKFPNYDKIYFIHGYQSSPNGDKGILFKEKLNATAIKYRNCQPEKLIISDCLKTIADEIKKYQKVALIGSSLGGFLAASISLNFTNVKKLILLNPAIIPPLTNLNEINDLPKKILKDMIDNRLFENRIKADIIILRGVDDNLIPENWITKFASAQEATVKFLQDDHRFSDYLENLPKIISDYLK